MNDNLPQLKFSNKRTIAETCPCGKDNKDGKFAPYIGFVNCGYCHSCGETFLPPIESNQITTIKRTPPTPPIEKIISFIPVDLFKASLRNYDKNHFIKFLIERFGTVKTNELISTYFLGTSKHWSGANVFWQIDQSNKIRTGKIMLYNATDGKRIKKPYDCVNWVHKVIKQPEFELKQCFFGEHLLIDRTKTVAIIESEKSAIISSVYFPKFIWLSVGGKTNLTIDRIKVLQGRKVVLFPDLNCFDHWQNIAKECSKIASISVSDLLERIATEAEKKEGLDLADYLLNFDYKKSGEPKPPKIEKVNDFSSEPIKHPKKEQNEDWSNDITELENYFSKITLPIEPVKLNQCSVITNISLFIESHFATVKRNNGNRTYLPYLQRLQELKQILTINNKKI